MVEEHILTIIELLRHIEVCQTILCGAAVSMTLAIWVIVFVLTRKDR